jgi:hypothetical protein
MAGSTFGQDQAKENPQKQPSAPMTTAPDQQGGMKSDSAHSGMMGSKMTMVQCQDLAALEKKNPEMTKDTMKDDTCASMMHKAKGNAGPSAVSQPQGK